jgi:alpha-tubulin suppressor-like RCC1 family protein
VRQCFAVLALVGLGLACGTETELPVREARRTDAFGQFPGKGTLPRLRGEMGSDEPPPSRWSSVSAGMYHTCAVAADGSVWCWGQNGQGLLGTGPVGIVARPSRVGADYDWREVVTGVRTTCAMKNDQSLWCWGNDRGTYFFEPTEVPGDDWIALADVGADDACAAKGDGSVWCLGWHEYWWPTADGWESDPLAAFEPIPAGLAFAAKTVVAWNAVGFAIAQDGSLHAWGINESGTLGLGHTDGNESMSYPWHTWVEPTRVGTEQDWIYVEAACGIREGGTLWCWGLNEAGQVGNGEATGWALPEEPVLSPTWVGREWRWAKVVTGGYRRCGITVDGELSCWGSNSLGQLGTGDDQPHLEPGSFIGRRPWRDVSLSGGHTCAIEVSGLLWCWGSNAKGQLGVPGLDGSRVPVLVVEP